MKVVHVGNVANIAYLNTKFLRRLGMEADLYYYDFDLCLAQPEWEDAQIELLTLETLIGVRRSS
jgi:hypothetical protein